MHVHVDILTWHDTAASHKHQTPQPFSRVILRIQPWATTSQASDLYTAFREDELVDC